MPFKHIMPAYPMKKLPRNSPGQWPSDIVSGTILSPQTKAKKPKHTPMKKLIKIGLLLACLAGACLFSSQAMAAASVLVTKSSALNGVGAWIPAGIATTWNDASFQIPAGGSDRKLVVLLGGEGAMTFGVTWNGTALTRVAGIIGNGTGHANVYALDNPAPGTGPLIVTPSGGTRYSVAALYATNVVGEVQSAVNGGAAAVLSATTARGVPSGSLVVSVAGHDNGPGGMTADSGVQSAGAVQVMNTAGNPPFSNGSSAGADYLTNAPGGSTLTATWTQGASLSGGVGVVIVAFGANPETVITVQPASATNWTGLNQQFSVTAFGTPPLSYQWYLGTPGGSHVALANDSQISGSTNSTLTVSNLVVGNSTNYYVVITNTAWGAITSSVASLTVLPFTGIMSGTGSASPALLGLTAQGPLDWIVWGYPDENSFEQKAGGTNVISNVTVTSDDPTWENDGGFYNYTWSDGTTTPAGSSDFSIYYHGGITTAAEFTVPAGTTPKVLTVYAGAWQGVVEVRSTLSDLSAPPFIGTYNPGGGGAIRAWKIVFAAGSANQTNTIRVSLPSASGGGPGLELGAATLAGPLYIVTSPASAMNWPGYNQTFSVVADGAPPFSYQWYKGTPSGSYVALANGGQISGSTSNALTISNLVVANATNYFVVVTNIYGAVTSSVASLAVFPVTGTIVGSSGTPPASINLTTDGTLDWAHWGLLSGAAPYGFDQKMGGTNVISDVTITGNFDGPNLDADTAEPTSWSDGTPTPTATLTDRFVEQGGGSFQIDVAAKTTAQVLKVYVKGWNTELHFEAGLSDASAPPYVDESFNTGGAIDRQFVYKITFAAGSPGKTLHVKAYDRRNFGNAYFGISAASLAGPAPVIVTQPVSSTNWVGLNQQFSVAADGPSLSYQWYKGTPGGSHVALANGGQISGSTSNMLTISNLVLANATNYYAVVANVSGVVTSSVAGLAVFPITGSMIGGNNLALPALIDLTAEGTLDWIVWGYPDENSYERKAGGTNVISDFTMTGDGANRQADDSFYNYTWSDGATTPAGTGNQSIYFGGLTATICSFTVPAGTTPKVLTVYAGEWRAAVNVRATLSDNSAPVVVGTYDQGAVYGGAMRAFPIEFAAGSEGQTLTVTVNLSVLNGGDGAIELGAATLANPPTLQLSRSGPSLLLTWPTGTLLEATNVTGPWVMTTNTSPLTVTPSEPQMFYRVQVP
jgi:P pilus assembly chaperone PapD